MYGFYGNFTQYYILLTQVNNQLHRDSENKTGRIDYNDTNHLSARLVCTPLSLLGQEHTRSAKGGKTTKKITVQPKYVSKLTHMY